MISEIIKTIKESGKRKKEIFETNKKKYWKLPASERLHYDSVRKKIDNEYEFTFMSITFGMLKLFFYFFAFLLIIRLLFELDKEIFIRVLSILIPIFPLFFKISILADIFIAFSNSYNEKKSIKKLMKNYGFEL